MKKNSDRWIEVVVLMLLIGSLICARKFFVGAVESDYLGTYVPEAKRLLAGTPLELKFHLPLYSVLMAFLNFLFHDWWWTGLAVSFFSALISIVMLYSFFSRLSGKWEARGAMLALASSQAFLIHTASAGSDLFFLALYSTALWSALSGSIKPSKKYWIITGTAAGCAILTRQNAVSLLPILILPLLSKETSPKKIAHLGLLLFFIALPVVAWFLYARVNGSPFLPQETHLNLAMTYFSPTQDRMTYDAYEAAKRTFQNLTQVFSHDPVHLLATYVKDFAVMCARNVILLVPPWIGFPALFGLPVFIRKSKKPFVAVFLSVTFLHILLINFKTYEYRFYLFLAPLLGAAAGALIESWFDRNKERAKSYSENKLGFVFFIVFISSALFFSWQAHRVLHSPFERELEEAVPKILEHVPHQSFIVARKPHVAFYADAEFVVFPNVSTLEELHNHLSGLEESLNVFLYYGFFERQMRPQFESLHTPAGHEFLEPIAWSKKPPNWALYKVRR